MGTNCAPLLADLFILSYEADFVADLFQKIERRLPSSVSAIYIYDVLLNNPSFRDLYIASIPKNLIKKTIHADTVKSASYFYLHFDIDGK